MTPEQKFVEAMLMWRRHGDYIEGCEQCDAIRAACEAFGWELAHECCHCCHMTECPDYEGHPDVIVARILKGVFGDD